MIYDRTHIDAALVTETDYEYYRPSISAYITPATTDKATFRFKAPRAGRRWAIATLQAVGAMFSGSGFVTVTMRSGSNLQRVHFKDVHLNTLEQLCSQRALVAPIIIADGTDVVFEVTGDVGSTPWPVTITLEVYSGRALDRYLASLERVTDENRVIPEITFLWISAFSLIPSGESLPLTVTAHSHPVLVNRIAIGGPAMLKTLITITTPRDTLWKAGVADAINQFYQRRNELTPFTVDSGTPLRIQFKNEDTTFSRSVSALLECYRWNPAQEMRGAV